VGGRNSSLATGALVALDGGSSTATATGASLMGGASGNGASAAGPFLVLGFFVATLGIVSNWLFQNQMSNGEFITNKSAPTLDEQLFE